jgi:hypothetical protein
MGGCARSSSSEGMGIRHLEACGSPDNSVPRDGGDGTASTAAGIAMGSGWRSVAGRQMTPHILQHDVDELGRSPFPEGDRLHHPLDRTPQATVER